MQSQPMPLVTTCWMGSVTSVETSSAAAPICVFEGKLMSGLPLLLADTNGLVAGLLISLTSTAASLLMATSAVCVTREDSLRVGGAPALPPLPSDQWQWALTEKTVPFIWHIADDRTGCKTSSFPTLGYNQSCLTRLAAAGLMSTHAAQLEKQPSKTPELLSDTCKYELCT